MRLHSYMFFDTVAAALYQLGITRYSLLSLDPHQ
jgi:hypothetical protein